jgi:hypothetical protein
MACPVLYERPMRRIAFLVLLVAGIAGCGMKSTGPKGPNGGISTSPGGGVPGPHP